MLQYVRAYDWWLVAAVIGRFPGLPGEAAAYVPDLDCQLHLALAARWQVVWHVAQLNEGVVVAVGPGRRSKAGELIPNDVKEGDTVMLPEYGGQAIMMDNEKCDSARLTILPRLLGVSFASD